MATTTASFGNWRCYYSNSWYSEKANSSVSTSGFDGNMAGFGAYSVFKISWNAISGADLDTLSVTVGLRKYGVDTVSATAYLSTQAYGNSFNSSYVVDSDSQSVTFSNFTVKMVTFEFDISDLSASSNQTLYVWIGGGDKYFLAMTNSSGRKWSNELTYTLKTYTVKYSTAYGTAPSSHSKTHGVNLELRAFISNQNINSHVVKFNANGGNSTPNNITSKTIKTQQNWKDTDGTTYASKGSYTKNKAMTMTATWDSGTQQSVTLPGAISKNPSESKYTISYNANNPNTDSTTSTTPSSQSLTRITTYSFKKWAEGSATSTTTYSAGASYTPGGEVTMYATWNTNAPTDSITLASKMTKGDTTVNGYKVTLNPNGGICDKKSLTAVNTIKWNFNNWNTAANGSGTSYNAGSSYSKDSGAIMYAQWTSAIKTYGLVDLPTPTKVGYKFAGWAESADATSGVTGSYQPEKAVTLYAIWVPDGGVRVYLKKYGSYKIALVYICIDGTWRLTIPYIYDKTSSSWKILGG